MANQDFCAVGASSGGQSGAGSQTIVKDEPASVKEQVKQKAADVAHQAKDAAREAVHEAKEQASLAASKLREKGESVAGRQKERMADEVGRIGAAIRKAADSLRQDGDERLGEYTQFCADRFEQGASYLKDRGVRDILGDVEGFARRHPEVVFGGLFLGGLLFGRFLKASRPSGHDRDFDEDFERVDRRYAYGDASRETYGRSYEDEYDDYGYEEEFATGGSAASERQPRETSFRDERVSSDDRFGPPHNRYASDMEFGRSTANKEAQAPSFGTGERTSAAGPSAYGSGRSAFGSGQHETETTTEACNLPPATEADAVDTDFSPNKPR
jgi:hypothetical protein